MIQSVTTNLRVLVVEDNREHRLVTELALIRDPAIACHAFETAEAALAWTSLGGMFVDVVLVDFVLADSTGVELILQLRKLPATHAATMVIMTALVPPSGTRDARFVPADGVILKPFEVLTLPRRIRAMHEARRARTTSARRDDSGQADGHHAFRRALSR